MVVNTGYTLESLREHSKFTNTKDSVLETQT